MSCTDRRTGGRRKGRWLGRETPSPGKSLHLYQVTNAILPQKGQMHMRWGQWSEAWLAMALCWLRLSGFTNDRNRLGLPWLLGFKKNLFRLDFAGTNTPKSEKLTSLMVYFLLMLRQHCHKWWLFAPRCLYCGTQADRAASLWNTDSIIADERNMVNHVLTLKLCAWKWHWSCPLIPFTKVGTWSSLP